MRPRPAGLSQVTHRAIIQRPAVTLELDELDGIVRFPAGGDGVRAVVAGLAVNTAMPLGEAVQGVILVVLHVNRGDMAAITAWLIQPGIRILLHLFHAPVAVDAVHHAGWVEGRGDVQ